MTYSLPYAPCYDQTTINPERLIFMWFKRLLTCITMLLLGQCCLLGLTDSAQAQSNFDAAGEIAICSRSKERILRFCGQTADLSGLGEDEFYSFVLRLKYTGNQPLNISSFYVRVDGGDKWHWGTQTLEPNQQLTCHIYAINMAKCMSPGAHTIVWYINDQPILTQTLTFTAPSRWYSRFAIPSSGEIAQANRTATVRSPYLFGWLKIPDQFRYTEYAIDFKADYVPKATYCALANLQMDLSPLQKQYRNVRNEYAGVNLYAGFQRRWNEYNTIMSAWDTYYTDHNGVEHTIRPRQVYPDQVYIGNGAFSGEGTGLQMLIPYEWDAGHWYRMLLQCSWTETGSTMVEQWVCDLESGVWTLMSKCDTGIPNSCFIGGNCFFLENFDNKFAGEIRAMEVCNARIRSAESGQWQSILTATLGSRGGMPAYNGSYAYGAEDNCFYMITSGAGGDWFGTDKVPANHTNYTVNSGAASSPY